MRCCLILCFEYYKAWRAKILTFPVAFVCIWCLKVSFALVELCGSKGRQAEPRNYRKRSIWTYNSVFMINKASSVNRGRVRPTTKKTSRNMATILRLTHRPRQPLFTEYHIGMDQSKYLLTSITWPYYEVKFDASFSLFYLLRYVYIFYYLRVSS